MSQSANGVARDAYLDSLSAPEQAAILRRAEKDGPLPSDSDWLVAYASQQAADRIEAAETRIAALLTAHGESPVLAGKLDALSASIAAAQKKQKLFARQAAWTWTMGATAVGVGFFAVLAVALVVAGAQRNVDAQLCRGLIANGISLPVGIAISVAMISAAVLVYVKMQRRGTLS